MFSKALFYKLVKTWTCLVKCYPPFHRALFKSRNHHLPTCRLYALSSSCLANVRLCWYTSDTCNFYLLETWNVTLVFTIQRVVHTIKGDNSKCIFFFRIMPFLAHLSTTCSGGAIVTGHRPASVRPSVCPSICPSVNNFFENLLQNQKANLDKTWQECSLGEALQKLLKEFNSN